MLIIGYFYCKEIPIAKFHYDESHWIHTSSYFEILLSENSDSRFWDENYWTLTQPPVARYIIGLSRNIFGVDTDQLNDPWEFSLSYEENAANGCLPSDHLLKISRLPMALIATLTGTILFILLLDGFGLVPSLIFLSFFIFNDYLKRILVRAMGDPPLVLFITLSAFFCIKALIAYKCFARSKHNNDLEKAYLLFFISGFCCGLAAASKINGFISCISIFAIVIGVTIISFPDMNTGEKLKLIIRICFVVAFASLFAFIIINPYLYSNPIVRMGRMYKFRFQEMAIQINGFPNQYINSIHDRYQVIQNQIFSDFMPFKFIGSNYLLMLLTIAGFINAVKSIYVWLTNHSGSPHVFVLSALFFPLAAAGYMSPLNWERYFVTCVVLNIVLIPSGIVFLSKIIYPYITIIFNKSSYQTRTRKTRGNL